MTEEKKNQGSQEQQQGFELKLSEETMGLLQDYARKTGQSEEQVAEHIIGEYLQNQLPAISKRAEETGAPVEELLNTQFEKLLQMLRDRDLKKE